MTIKDRIDVNFLYYFDNGDCTNAYEFFGAHVLKDEQGKITGCEFALYAPNASKVEIIGDWNNFERDKTVLKCLDPKGIWYTKLDGDLEWKRYKYVITTKSGEVLYKADPYAFYSEMRPCQDSKICDIDGYDWKDKDWVFNHPKTYDKPMLIYEMHLASWKRPDNKEFYCFSEIAPMLVDYLKDYGYTHVEVMPVYEHPLDASWGYQGTGYYAISPRFGSPKDFMYFVDYLHQHGIGVIMDWVPGHICKDGHGLYRFDGTFLYEYPKEEDRENKEWGTVNLDLGKGTTRSFLFSNAMFYLKYFHVDGFRVDAVSNMIYYLGNTNRGVNEGACEFMRRLSTLIFSYDDRLILAAEDSSAFPHVTLPSGMGGLGFNYKWDMGWMNDTLKYFKMDPVYRKYHHNMLTFSMMYYYNEQFLLTFSHDEVVHMKGSLLNKMPGDRWKQFAQYKTLIGYMLTHPGKKLLFMGDELASYDEWHFESELPWNIKKYPDHDSAQRFVRELSVLYKNEPCLWELDYKPEGFKFMDADNADLSLYSYMRYDKDGNRLLVVMNCTPNSYDSYRIGVDAEVGSTFVELINSDKDIYGGTNKINSKAIKVEAIKDKKNPNSISMAIPPLGIVILKNKKKVTRKCTPKSVL